MLATHNEPACVCPTECSGGSRGTKLGGRHSSCASPRALAGRQAAGWGLEFTRRPHCTLHHSIPNRLTEQEPVAGGQRSSHAASTIHGLPRCPPPPQDDPVIQGERAIQALLDARMPGARASAARHACISPHLVPRRRRARCQGSSSVQQTLAAPARPLPCTPTASPPPTPPLQESVVSSATAIYQRMRSTVERSRAEEAAGLDAHALTAGKPGLEPQRSASESAIAQLTATERAVLSRKEVRHSTHTDPRLQQMPLLRTLPAPLCSLQNAWPTRTIPACCRSPSPVPPPSSSTAPAPPHLPGPPWLPPAPRWHMRSPPLSLPSPPGPAQGAWLWRLPPWWWQACWGCAASGPAGRSGGFEQCRARHTGIRCLGLARLCLPPALLVFSSTASNKLCQLACEKCYRRSDKHKSQARHRLPLHSSLSHAQMPQTCPCSRTLPGREDLKIPSR